MTKDVENIFINEQQEKIEIPAVGNVSTNEDELNFLRELANSI